MKNTLRPSKDGYTVDVGHLAGKKSQPRFYLGWDEHDAQIKKLKINQLWVSQRGQPYWSATNVAAARAIAAGKPLHIPPTFDATAEALISLLNPKEQPAARALAYRQKLVGAALSFPDLKIVPTDPDLAVQFEAVDAQVIQDGQDVVERQRAALESVLGRPMPGVRTTHELLDAYKQSCIVLDHDGIVSEASMVTARRIEFIRRSVPNVSLLKLDYLFMQQVTRTLFDRPLTKWGRPAAPIFARACVKTWKDFIRFVSRNTNDNEWCPPREWESAFKCRRRRKTDDERAAAVKDGGGDAIVKKLFTTNELRSIWKTAQRKTEWRVMFMLGLNCGHGVSETCKLQWAEVQGDIINRLRPKTEVYGQWKLWPETLAALAALPKRAKYVLVRHGTDKPYLTKTQKGNRSDKLAGRWRSLLVKAGLFEWRTNRKGERYKFVKSYGRLRKTSSSLIRAIVNGTDDNESTCELASMQLAHGHPADDKLLEAYAQKPWAKLFTAQERVHEQLVNEGVLGTGASPK